MRYTVAAANRVAQVRDDTDGRLRLAADFYRGGRRWYRTAELDFLQWEVGRGVLNPPAAPRPGSPWWRAVNDRLLQDKIEAEIRHAAGLDGERARSVELWLEFIAQPSPRGWYRAHNASIVAAYLEHERLAELELPIERFFMNVALLRVLFAHALVDVPRLAAGRFGPIGRLLGDPRLPTVGVFVDLRRAFPDVYPLEGLALPQVIAAERRRARALDYGVIAPRIPELYAFAAKSLGEPRIAGLADAGLPCYAMPAADRGTWLLGNVGAHLRLIARATGAGGGYDRVFRLRS